MLALVVGSSSRFIAPPDTETDQQSYGSNPEELQSAQELSTGKEKIHNGNEERPHLQTTVDDRLVVRGHNSHEVQDGAKVIRDKSVLRSSGKKGTIANGNLFP
jgi:hypothetical protein